MALATLGVVVLDCPDPRALADFYAEVLGGTVTSDDGTWVDLEVPAAGRSRSRRRPTSRHRPGPRPTGRSSSTWTSRSRTSTRRRRACWPWARRSLDAEDRSRTWRVYADPAGHPFCLCAC